MSGGATDPYTIHSKGMNNSSRSTNGIAFVKVPQEEMYVLG